MTYDICEDCRIQVVIMIKLNDLRQRAKRLVTDDVEVSPAIDNVMAI